MTQVMLAQRLGVTSQLVSLRERGKAALSDRDVIATLQALDDLGAQVDTPALTQVWVLQFGANGHCAPHAARLARLKADLWEGRS